MDPSMKRPQSPLVVFGPDHIDTSRAEMLIQRLSDKIKEKRFKLQKMVGINEEKKKRTETMKNEKLQLTTKLANIEQDNSLREQQLRSEQARIKELQFNIQMLDEHKGSIKRDCLNEERKYEEEKCILINKFERTKQQWTDVFKPQYEQSKVYQYLKQGDSAYNSLVKRKETLFNTQKIAYKDYLTRRDEFCNEKQFQFTILSIAKYFLSRRDQLIKIQQMKEKLIELENKEKYLIENKSDKMKAWESVYTQPSKRDLMDFCLQTNIEQALTLSFNQMQQDIWSQPTTPISAPQNQLGSEEQSIIKPSVTSHSSTSMIHSQSVHHSPPRSTASSITLVPNTAKSVPIASYCSSVSHLTTAFDDDDDELFSTSRRKIPIAQLEQMSINDCPPSTQAFVTSTPATNSNTDVDREMSTTSQNDQPLTQAFTVPSSASLETCSMRDFITPTLNTKVPETEEPMASADVLVDKLHPNVTFQLAPPPPRIQSRPGNPVISSIKPQVTSNDVQQMLLTFSPSPSSINEEQQQQQQQQAPQPMETDTEGSQQQQQQRPTFSMASSIESTASTEDGYTGFNYDFGFDGGAVIETGTDGRGFTSPINFGNWANLNSPVPTSSNDQFSAFLQQTNSGDTGVDNSFSFASFNYGDLGGGGEAATDGSFGSFFFGNDGSPNNKEHTADGT